MSRSIMGLVISLLLFAMLFPTAMVYVITMQYVNVTVGTTVYMLGDIADPIIITLLCTILPIVLVIGYLNKFLKSR